MRSRFPRPVAVPILLLLLAVAPAPPAPAAATAEGASSAAPTVELPEVVLLRVPFTLVVHVTAGADSVRLLAPGGGWEVAPLTGEAEPRPLPRLLPAADGEARLEGLVLRRRGAPLAVAVGDERIELAPRVVPGWLTILPPLLAIGIALLLRQVLVALLLGVYAGAVILAGGNPLTAFLHLIDRFLVEALADRSHASILVFTSLLGGMVGVITRVGGMEGLVRSFARRVRTRRGGQVATAMMGTAIFFDDYANTLLVGNSMRPLTDRLKISREKLSYLVDSTAAPIAMLAVISTWIGFEVGLIQEAMTRLGDQGSAYAFFLRSIPYSFYPLLTVWFLYAVAWTGRDFGPMRAAEARAWRLGQVLRPGAVPAADTMRIEEQQQQTRPSHPLFAIGPVLVVIAGTMGGLWYDGAQKLAAAGQPADSLRAILNAADSFDVLLWSSLAGALTAIGAAVLSRRLSLRQALDGWVAGAQAMLLAIVILLLAWSLSAVCTALQTAPWLVEVTRGALSAHLLPALTFLLASAVSFATGTSWGTMAILMPLVFPLGAVLPAASGMSGPAAAGVHLASARAVLSGAVFGDHCSPISDTTIMSSMASGSDHVDHVRTQLPYALVVAVIATLTGYLPSGYGVSVWVSLAAGAVIALAWLRWRGRRPEQAS